MVLVRVKLFAAALVLCEIPVSAREVMLTEFPSTAGASDASGSTVGPLGDILRHHFESMTGPTFGSVTKDRQHPARPNWRFSSIELSSTIAEPCVRTEYTPTWWLAPETELRRSAHFGAMSSIACESGLPTTLLDAVILQESSYKGWAISQAGALGMMQIMPDTAKSLGLTNPWDSVANMRAGARYLRQQLDRFGRVDLALAAYNAGPERRSLAQGYVPAIPETRNYVRAITTSWRRLTQLNRPDSTGLARAAAASVAVRASGYREVLLVTYDGMNSANPT